MWLESMGATLLQAKEGQAVELPIHGKLPILLFVYVRRMRAACKITG